MAKFRIDVEKRVKKHLDRIEKAFIQAAKAAGVPSQEIKEALEQASNLDTENTENTDSTKEIKSSLNP